MRSLQTQAQWCNRAQWVLGLSLVLLVGGFYSLVYRPNNQKLADLRDQIRSKQTNLTTNIARAQVLPDVLSANFAMQSRFDQFEKRIPENIDLGAFIHDITDLSDQCGLRTKWDIKPGSPVHGDKERFAELPIAMNFEGDFLNVCTFLRRSELMQRLTKVKGLKIHGMENGKSGTVQVELSMNIYYLEG